MINHIFFTGNNCVVLELVPLSLGVKKIQATPLVPLKASSKFSPSNPTLGVAHGQGTGATSFPGSLILPSPQRAVR